MVAKIYSVKHYINDSYEQRYLVAASSAEEAESIVYESIDKFGTKCR